MMDDVVEGLLEFLFHVFIEIVCFYTSEFVLSIITLGNKKIRWDFYADASPTKFIIFTEIRVWIGMFFWIVIIGLIARTFLSIKAI
jgi:hypothetical protein